MKKLRQHGFTLIELSIVLVVVGLIVGGVLAGRSLIEAAALQSVITDVQKFDTAVNTFQVKYGCLPGDCPNASALLGLREDTGNCPINNPADPGTTCNGNGDGNITAGFDTSALQRSHAETYLAWQHLAVAGLVAGSYGNTASGGVSVASTTSPASRISGACFDIMWGWPDVGEGWVWGSEYALSGNFIDFGIPVQYWNACGGGYCSSRCHEPALTALQAYGVDSKIDDGLPTTGAVVSNTYPGGLPACFTPWDGVAYKYNISGSSGPACPLAFRGQGF